MRCPTPILIAILIAISKSQGIPVPAEDPIKAHLEAEFLKFPNSSFEGDPSLLQHVDKLNTHTTYNSPSQGNPTIYERPKDDSALQVIVLTKEEDGINFDQFKRLYIVLRKKAGQEYYVSLAFVRDASSKDTDGVLDLPQGKKVIEWDTWEDHVVPTGKAVTQLAIFCSSTLLVACDFNDDELEPSERAELPLPLFLPKNVDAAELKHFHSMKFIPAEGGERDVEDNYGLYKDLDSTRFNTQSGRRFDMSMMAAMGPPGSYYEQGVNHMFDPITGGVGNTGGFVGGVLGTASAIICHAITFIAKKCNPRKAGDDEEIIRQQKLALAIAASQDSIAQMSAVAAATLGGPPGPPSPTAYQGYVPQPPPPILGYPPQPPPTGFGGFPPQPPPLGLPSPLGIGLEYIPGSAWPMDPSTGLPCPVEPMDRPKRQASLTKGMTKEQKEAMLKSLLADRDESVTESALTVKLPTLPPLPRPDMECFRKSQQTTTTTTQAPMTALTTVSLNTTLKYPWSKRSTSTDYDGVTFNWDIGHATPRREISEPKVVPKVSNLHGWKTQFKTPAAGIATADSAEVFYGIGNCKPHKSGTAGYPSLASASTQDEFISFYLKVLRIDCLQYEKSYVETLLAKKLLEVKGMEFRVNDSHEFLTTPKLPLVAASQLSAAFELDAFSQIYAQEMQGASEKASLKSPDGSDISQSVQFLKKYTFKILTESRRRVRRHYLHLTRNLVQMLRIVFAKLAQDSFKLSNCLECELDKKVNYSDRLLVQALQSFVKFGLRPLDKTGEEPENLFNQLYIKNKALNEAFVKTFS